MMSRGILLPVVNSVLCIMIIILCVFVFLTRGVGVYAARATGESMLPTIPSDALLIISQRSPEIGDIVLVKNHQYNYAHRLVEINGGTITTKGDNCEWTEVAVLGDVSGVVIFHVPFKSFLVLSLAVIMIETTLGFFWAFGTIFNVRRHWFPLVPV